MSFDKNKILSKAQKLIQQGKLPKAIDEFQKIVDTDPSDVRTHLKIGDLHAKLGNIEGATDTYKKVAEHYAKDGFFLKAIAVFKQILKLDPGVIKVYLRLAELYNQLGLNSEAMKQYQVVVKHYENKGMKKESLDVLQKMADLDPDNVASKVKLAELYTKEGFQDQAIQQFENVAKELKNKNNFEDLIKVLEKMASMNPEDKNCLRELSSVYLKVGEPKKALAKLQVCFKADPKESQTLELLAQAFVDLQQPEKAKSVYRELLVVYEEKGMIEEKGAVEARMKELLPEESFHPSQASFMEDSAAGEAKSAEEDELLAVGEESQVASPEKESDSASKLVSEIDVYLKYGLLDKAVENLIKGLENFPENIQLKEKLAHLLKAEAGNSTVEKPLEDNLARLKNAGNQKTVKLVEAIRGGGTPQASEVPEEVEEIEEEVLLVEDEVLEEIEEEGEAPAQKSPPEKEVPEKPKIEFPEDVPADLEQEMVREDSSSDKIELSTFEVPESQEAQEVPDELSLEIEPEKPEPDLSLDIKPEAAKEKEEAAPEPIASESEDAPKEVSKAKEIISKKSDQQDSHALKYKDEMEEADFFIKQGLLEEAKYIYESIVEAEPSFEEAKGKLKEIEDLINKDIQSKVRSKFSSIDIEPPQEEQDQASGADLGGGDLFDLGKELESEIKDLNVAQPDPQDEAVMTFEEMFKQFKKGVNASLSPDDYQAHYDLGVAYKEMGLLEDAVSEFKTSMGEEKLRINSISMIGLCYTAKGECDNAVKIFEEGLKHVERESEEGLSFLFDMAEAIFAKGDFEKALEVLREIRNKKKTFRNVTKRINEIEALMAEKAKIEASGVKQKETKTDTKEDEKDDDDDDDDDEGENENKQDKISYI